MTGISGINIVIQQGDVAREAQHLKSSHQDANQVAASVIPDKAVKERTQVQQTPDSKKSDWEKEKQREKDRRKARKKAEGSRKKSGKGKNDSNRILDTIA
ncbi:MAG: hypothetical protein RBR08_10055 [Desulforegulaceae bacterium]|jgi:hypothetical protein|nr:hypothetical protein [Desulforegulaceae bacterium]